MKFYYLLFLSLFSTSILFSQIEQGGVPYSSLNALPVLETMLSFPEIDIEKLRFEDNYYDQRKDIPYRFGHNFNVNYNTSNSGEWSVQKNGDRIWRASFYSEGAQSLNFLLQNFNLAPGASIFFYNDDKSVVLGSFTYKNNRAHHNLSTLPLPGSKYTIEFFEPASVAGQSTFDITRVTHGYRTFKLQTKGVDDSGNCNNNVICSVGDNWRDQIRSVGIILVNGNSSCTGAMINNTCQDKTPYFLTADHCTGSDVTTWSVGFNFESTDCNSNVGFNANNFQSVNVLEMKAQDGASDFALVELVQSPPPTFNVFYAGWDVSGDNPTSQVGIHHPAGDLKKISFDNDPAGSANWGGATNWHIFNWEDGTTEPGSSGSPLFDQNKRIIGQLYGGTANCNNNIDDYYGKIDVSWGLGLSEWLDPSNLGVETLDGLDGATIIPDDIAITFLNKPKTVNCGTNIYQEIVITNNGSNTVTSFSFDYGLSTNVQNYTWTGNLATGDFETISFDELILCKGNYNYTLEITEYNGSIDLILCNNNDGFSFEAVNGSDLEVVIQTNFEEEETSFEIYNNDDVLVYSVTDFESNELHTFNYCLPYGNYSFRMKDSGGNGLTPTFFVDAGYYSISLDGVELVNNDAFGAEETTDFLAVGNGIFADFLNPDQFVNENFTLLSNSSGSGQVFEWSAPSATNTNETNIVFNTSFSSVGTFPVTLKVTNSNACDFISKNIRVNSNTVSINTIDDFFRLNIYPNPTNQFINIETDNFLNTSFKVLNNIGQTVLEDKLISNETILDVSSFDSGIYFIELYYDRLTTIEKFVVK